MRAKIERRPPSVKRRAPSVLGRRSGPSVMDIKSWSEGVAELAVDALLDAGLVRREDFDRAVSIVAEEILVRLALGDYPPEEE